MVSNHNRKLFSFFFQRDGAVEYVRPGAVFRRVRSDRVTETAEIVDVYMDPSGIPHFRYDLSVKCPYRAGTREGVRALAANSFFEQYTERLDKHAVTDLGESLLPAA